MFLCTCAFGATVRSSNNTTIRQDTQQSKIARQTTNRSKLNVIDRSTTSKTLDDSQKITARSATKKVSARNTNTKIISPRSATNINRLSRATTTTPQVTTRTFGNNYTTCRDAYFTCMDQFCATQNDTYRRCVCSSRLQKIQEQEGLLSQTTTNLQDFHDFNIDAIPKTAEEVKAMQTASDGEKGIKEDKSTSSTTLKNIKEVLSKTKENSLSTQGTLDIAGDIKNIWKTTDLIRGYDIANLTGEALYNAVNAQCYEMVSSQCASSDLKMVASAYGMYIENDCELLATAIKNQTTNANAAIRTTRHEMQDARLENYDAHNSLSLNDCIMQVKQDITANTACGQNYVHCLDITGKYLDINTGEPIYSPDFYQFENQISLSGDVLKNNKNKNFVNMLNTKQKFANQTLDSCRDVADNVWDEFLRQALVEISQAQQQRIQTVKHDCLQVVNKCYLNKSDTLKEFANDASTVTTRDTLELSEALCAEKLNTCSNLYGGGPEGLDLLVSTMQQITDTTIAQECPVLLKQYVEKLCAVLDNDSSHSYPYGCRTYAPGEARYARNKTCNTTLTNPFEQTNILFSTPIPNLYQNCSGTKKYTSCNAGFYLANSICKVCEPGYICPGGGTNIVPIDTYLATYNDCGMNYIGSLYQALVIYATQNCTRTTNTEGVLSETILADINKTMTTVRSALVKELSKECTNLNGLWVDAEWRDNNKDGKHDTTKDKLLNAFYMTTAANPLWGYCKQP